MSIPHSAYPCAGKGSFYIIYTCDIFKIHLTFGYAGGIPIIRGIIYKKIDRAEEIYSLD